MFIEMTVILNTHNTEGAGPKVQRALTSLLDQEGLDGVKWEVVHVNDGPANDEIVAVAEAAAPSFEERGIDYTFFATEETSGYQCYPKNVAIYHAKGEYIGFLDYDNAYRPQHLSKLLSVLKEGDVWPDFAYGRREYKVDEGFDGKATLPGGNEIEVPTGESSLREWEPKNVLALMQHPLNNFIDTSDFLTSKGALWFLHTNTKMMWNEELRRFGDWELIVRMAMCGLRGRAVDGVLTNYYWTGKNMQLTRSPNEVPSKEVVEGS